MSTVFVYAFALLCIWFAHKKIGSNINKSTISATWICPLKAPHSLVVCASQTIFFARFSKAQQNKHDICIARHFHRTAAYCFKQQHISISNRKKPSACNLSWPHWRIFRNILFMITFNNRIQIHAAGTIETIHAHLEHLEHMLVYNHVIIAAASQCWTYCNLCYVTCAHKTFPEVEHVEVQYASVRL